mmetsp:Transcript_84748/g.236519  ORF Transcript_84748/g.236519 Transcript_84748/m.236519 type:complete len:362 (+) Transcript_84748:3003-4088(+)
MDQAEVDSEQTPTVHIDAVRLVDSICVLEKTALAIWGQPAPQGTRGVDRQQVLLAKNLCKGGIHRQLDRNDISLALAVRQRIDAVDSVDGCRGEKSNDGGEGGIDRGLQGQPGDNAAVGLLIHQDEGINARKAVHGALTSLNDAGVGLDPDRRGEQKVRQSRGRQGPLDRVVEHHRRVQVFALGVQDVVRGPDEPRDVADPVMNVLHLAIESAGDPEACVPNVEGDVCLARHVGATQSTHPLLEQDRRHAINLEGESHVVRLGFLDLREMRAQRRATLNLIAIDVDVANHVHQVNPVEPKPEVLHVRLQHSADAARAVRGVEQDLRRPNARSFDGQHGEDREHNGRRRREQKAEGEAAAVP